MNEKYITYMKHQKVTEKVSPRLEKLRKAIPIIDCHKVQAHGSSKQNLPLNLNDHIHMAIWVI